MKDDFIGRDIFHQLHRQWWDKNGPFAVLHNYNCVRIPYITQKIRQVGLDFDKISLLDIGCGGGIVSCQLFKMGIKNITAIDSLLENIEIAKDYSEKNSIAVNFCHKSVEDLVVSKIEYDVVICLEVLEHIEDWRLFVDNIKKILKKDGLLIISTISRNIWSYFSMIIGAECLLNIVPKRTHSWQNFINSDELIGQLSNFDLIDLSGVRYNPVLKKFSLSEKVFDNYILSFIKK